jgi:hypothetical protein
MPRIVRFVGSRTMPHLVGERELIALATDGSARQLLVGGPDADAVQ